MNLAAMKINGISHLQPSAGAGLKTEAPVELGFKDLLEGMVNKVDGLKKSADASIAGVVSGKVTDVHQVAVKVQEAGVAFDLMLGVRNRLMDGYQELIRMQV